MTQARRGMVRDMILHSVQRTQWAHHVLSHCVILNNPRDWFNLASMCYPAWEVLAYWNEMAVC